MSCRGCYPATLCSTSSRNARERGSRSRWWRRCMRMADSTSASTALGRRRPASASMSARLYARSTLRAPVDPGMRDAQLGNHVEGASPREHEVQLGEGFERATETARRLAHAPGDRLELAEMRGQEGEHPVGLADLEARQDDRVGSVEARDGSHRASLAGLT